ncbi:ATP-binding protein [Flavobacterium beibuense]|uniref:sensor histidine kinase n=1 Tax=Flavobacterium beibuense TaxID=657326 RepID=UPI003A8F9E43
MKAISFSFRNRIAFYYIVSTALLVFAVFVVIYFTVRQSVYSDVERDLSIEVADLMTEISINDTGFAIQDSLEWKEKEHNTLDINPIFIEFVDTDGNYTDKSPNLKESFLHIKYKKKQTLSYDTWLQNKSVRQIEVPVIHSDKVVGYILVAAPLEDAAMVLDNLSKILWIAYPLVLVVLFIIARIIAGRSIKPVASIMSTSNDITRDNLTSRIPLPPNKDELYTLSQTINNLLDRIQNAIEREKQFTSDASHELRTPLAVIKGTLEVLIRKPRDREEYEEKINFCISEVNRLNHMVDQLLLLARFENQKQSIKPESVYLNSVLLDTLTRYSQTVKDKNIQLVTEFDKDYYHETDEYLFSIIINNLISNAIKYSPDNGIITVSINENDGTCITINDNGMGIPAHDLQKIFNQFYRSKATEHSNIKGTGLGLSIVKRLCSLLGIAIDIYSKEEKGTTVRLFLR